MGYPDGCDPAKDSECDEEKAFASLPSPSTSSTDFSLESPGSDEVTKGENYETMLDPQAASKLYNCYSIESMLWATVGGSKYAARVKKAIPVEQSDGTYTCTYSIGYCAKDPQNIETCKLKDGERTTIDDTFEHSNLTPMSQEESGMGADGKPLPDAKSKPGKGVVKRIWEWVLKGLTLTIILTPEKLMKDSSISVSKTLYEYKPTKKADGASSFMEDGTEGEEEEGVPPTLDPEALVHDHTDMVQDRLMTLMSDIDEVGLDDANGEAKVDTLTKEFFDGAAPPA